MESKVENGNTYSFYKGLIQLISKAENQRDEILVVKKTIFKADFQRFHIQSSN